MELIRDREYGGERPLFATHDLRLERITIVDGESGIKQCQHMEADNCKFYGKYPWWHVDGALIEHSLRRVAAGMYLGHLVIVQYAATGKSRARVENLTLKDEMEKYKDLAAPR